MKDTKKKMNKPTNHPLQHGKNIMLNRETKLQDCIQYNSILIS